MNETTNLTTSFQIYERERERGGEREPNKNIQQKEVSDDFYLDI